MKPTRSARYVCGILGRYAALLAMLALVSCRPAALQSLTPPKKPLTGSHPGANSFPAF